MNPDEPRDGELSALRAEVSALEQRCAEQWRLAQDMRYAEEQLHAILDATQNAVAILENGLMVEVNQRFSDIFGYTQEECIGKGALLVAAPESREIALAHIRAGSEESYEATCVRKGGEHFPAEVRARRIEYQGRPARVTMIRDISWRKRAEEALRAALVEREVLRAQEALLSALQAPLLPIREGVLLLPLIGALTEARAEHVLTTLVEGIAARRAEIAILDVTGVADVDAHVAMALIRAAQAARLLGAEVVLTGIRPEVAIRLVHLDIDLTGLVTYGTLQRGVAHALARRGSGAQGDVVAGASAQQRKPTS